MENINIYKSRWNSKTPPLRAHPPISTIINSRSYLLLFTCLWTGEPGALGRNTSLCKISEHREPLSWLMSLSPWTQQVPWHCQGQGKRGTPDCRRKTLWGCKGHLQILLRQLRNKETDFKNTGNSRKTNLGSAWQRMLRALNDNMEGYSLNCDSSEVVKAGTSTGGCGRVTFQSYLQRFNDLFQREIHSCLPPFRAKVWKGSISTGMAAFKWKFPSLEICPIEISGHGKITQARPWKNQQRTWWNIEIVTQQVWSKGQGDF